MMPIGLQTGQYLKTHGAVRPMRPPELQGWLNRRLYHPLAWRIATRLARTPVTPNMVSIAGGLLVVIAAGTYVLQMQPLGAVIGLAIHMSWHVLDGADGDLARLTGRSGPKGELVDGICDYASHIALYLMLGALLRHDLGTLAWIVMAAAGVSRALQANHYEALRRQYQWWVHGVPWLKQAPSDHHGATAALGRGYIAMAAVLAPGAPRIDDILAEQAGNSTAIARVRGIVRAQADRLLPPRLLAADYRTLLLGLSMIAGSPIWYFLWEAIALNLVLIASIIRTRRGLCVTAELLNQPSTSR